MQHKQIFLLQSLIEKQTMYAVHMYVYMLKLMSIPFFINCLHRKIFSDKIDSQSLNRNRLWETADDFKVMKVTKQNTVHFQFILVINLLITN